LQSWRLGARSDALHIFNCEQTISSGTTGFDTEPLLGMVQQIPCAN